MVDEFKSFRDSLFKTLAGLSVTTRSPFEGDDEESDDDLRNGASGGTDARAARALIAALFAKAGKSKDEIVQIIAREIGLTVAAMLREPLSQIAKNQKLQISFELVPKDQDSKGGSPGPKGRRSVPTKRRLTKRADRRRKAEKSGT